MIPPARPKPFSMIREFHLADWFTLANAVCGTGALFSMMSHFTGAEDIALADTRIEFMFPADAATADFLTSLPLRSNIGPVKGASQ